MLTVIYKSWQQERDLRLWENFRMRAYERFYHLQYDDALKFFQLACNKAGNLGKNNFRYALALSDLAKIMVLKGEFEKARSYIGRAISIYDRQSNEDQVKFPIAEDKILIDCQLVELDLKSGKGAQKAWKDLGRALDAFNKTKAENIDPVVARTLCQTLSSVAEYSKTDFEIKAQACSKISEIATCYPSLKSLAVSNQQKMQCPYSGTYKAVNVEELISEAESKIGRKDSEAASKILEKAELLARSQAEPDLLLQVLYLKGKLEFSRFAYEEAEKNFIALLKNPELKDESIREDILFRLRVIYKIAAYYEDLIRVAKTELKLRERQYGADSQKLAEIDVELARALQDLGRFKEASVYAKHARDLFVQSHKNGMGRPGVSSERLSIVLVINNDLELAREILETIVQQYESGESKKDLIACIAYYDLAALSSVEGKRDACKQYLRQAGDMLESLKNRDLISVAETLKSWSNFLSLRSGAEAKDFVRAWVKSLVIPRDRKEALRVIAFSKKLDELKAKHPEFFTKELDLQLKKVRNEAVKFEQAKLSGFDFVTERF